MIGRSVFSMRPGLLTEEVSGLLQGADQGVDVGLVVVHVERRPGRAVDPETPHQRLGAVVARTHAYT